MAVIPYPWLKEPAERLASMRFALPNAILLHSTPGTGVFELAKAFAESLMCEDPAADGTPCGKCPGCHLTKAGTHPDCRIVVSEFIAEETGIPYTPEPGNTSRTKASREVRIHQFRALNDFLTLAPHRGGRRVVLVYPADMVRAEAAASLLKTMEEPPEGLTFILVADDIDAVLPTIRSRARIMRVGLPDHDVALKWLSGFKKVKNPEEALALAGGAPLLALKDTTGMMLSEKGQTIMKGLLLQGAALTPEAVVNGFDKKEITTPPMALYLSRWTSDLMRVKSGLAPHFFVTEYANMQTLVAQTSVKSLLSLNAAVAEVRRYAEHPLAPQLVFETVMLLYAKALRK